MHLEQMQECLKIESQIIILDLSWGWREIWSLWESVIDFQWKLVDGREFFAQIAAGSITTEQSELKNTRNRCKNVGQNLLDDLSYITNLLLQRAKPSRDPQRGPAPLSMSLMPDPS